MSNKEVIVKILDKEYQFSCPKEEEEYLVKSAQFLSKNMRDIRDSGKVIGVDRIAVMAALNITDQFLRIKEQDDDIDSSLNEKIISIREILSQVK
jgi:cell division protein ZapA